LKTIIGLVKFLIKRGSELAKLRHIETQEVVPDIYAIRTKNANFYVIKDIEEYIAIDAGCNEKMAKNELRKLNINPDKITSVFLTHTDPDHIAALSLFKNATIYISCEEIQMINGSTLRMFGIKNKLYYEYRTLENNEEMHFKHPDIRMVQRAL